MRSRLSLIVIGCLLFCLVQCKATGQPVATPDFQVASPGADAARIHEAALVMDTHCDALSKVLEDGVDLAVRSQTGHVDFPRLKEGGIDAEVFAVWVDPSYKAGTATRRALDMMDAFDRVVAANPAVVEQARTGSDIRRIAEAGRIAAILGVEGGDAIEGNLDNLKLFADRGVRYMTLTWWNNTCFADGSGDEPRWHGLNDLGRRVVAEMNRLGIIVDVSHASEETFWDVIETTVQPIIASHSNARALNDHHRNLTDDQLKAIAKTGGVVGINFVPGFLSPVHAAGAEEIKKELEPQFAKINEELGEDSTEAGKARWELFNEHAARLPKVPLDLLIDHIDHVAKVAGIDHVGLGSDFDGYRVGVDGMDDCTDYPRITEKLLARGYTPEDVAKILGGNFVRVFDRVAPMDQ